MDVAQGYAHVVVLLGDLGGGVGVAFRLPECEFAGVGQLRAALDLGVAAQGFGQVVQAVCPCEHGGVFVAACGEVVQPCVGGNLVYALPVVVAAAVIQIPKQAGGLVALGGEPPCKSVAV